MYSKITRAPEDIEKNRWLDLSFSNDAHHSMKCISSSKLKHIAQGNSMFSYYNRFILGNNPFVYNEALFLGSIIHLGLLEREKFEQQVIVSDMNQATVAFKEFKKDLCRKDQVITAKEPSERDITYLEELYSELKEKQELLATLEKDKCQEKIGVINNAIENINTTIKTVEDEFSLEKQEVKGRGKSKAKSKAKPKTAEEVKIITTKDGGFIDKNGLERFIIKPEVMHMIQAYQSQIDKHPRLSVYFEMGIFEQSGVAQDPETGLWMSIRGDVRCNLGPSRGFFLDPKTMADDLSSDNISKYASNFGLAIQQAHYIETANLIEPDQYKRFFFVMLSKKAPYEIAMIALDDEAVSYGIDKRRSCLRKLADCESSGKWAPYDYDPETRDFGKIISLPRWGMK